MEYIVDSVIESSISNSSIYLNTLVTQSEILTELENSSRCVNFWFASSGYIQYLASHESLFDHIVSFPSSISIIGNLCTIFNCWRKHCNWRQSNVWYGVRKQLMLHFIDNFQSETHSDQPLQFKTALYRNWRFIQIWL